MGVGDHRRRPRVSRARTQTWWRLVFVTPPCPRKDGWGWGAQEGTAVVRMDDLGGKGRAREMPHFPAGKLYERTKAHILSPVGRERECG